MAKDGSLNPPHHPPGEDGEKGGESVKDILYPRGVDSARVIQVVETKSARGSGAPEQPCRIVTEYWSLDGKKLAERDAMCEPRLSVPPSFNPRHGGQALN